MGAVNRSLPELELVRAPGMIFRRHTALPGGDLCCRGAGSLEFRRYRKRFVSRIGGYSGNGAEVSISVEDVTCRVHAGGDYTSIDFSMAC